MNGVKTTLDQFRGTPYIQADFRVSRPIRIRRALGDPAICRVLQPLQPQQSRRELRDRHFRAAHPGERSEQRHGDLRRSELHAIVPITSLKQLVVPAGGAGRLLRAGYHGGHSLRRAVGRAGEFLISKEGLPHQPLGRGVYFREQASKFGSRRAARSRLACHSFAVARSSCLPWPLTGSVS